MTRRRIILDTETTALEPDYQTGAGVIWELALIGLDDPIADDGHVWRMKPDLAKADPGALRVGRYYERTKDMCKECRPGGVSDLTKAPVSERFSPEWSAPDALAAHLAPLLDDATLIAANPTFDANFLTAFLRANGHAPTWHYRLRDIGSMAWGALAAKIGNPEKRPLDASTDYLADVLGVNPDKFERHSALGDCRLVAAMLRAIEAGEP